MSGINTTGPTGFAAPVTAGLKAGEVGPTVAGRRRPSVSAHCAGRPAGQYRRGRAGHPGRAAHRRLGPPGSLTQAGPEPGQWLAAWLRIFWMASGHAAKGADAPPAPLGEPAAQDATPARAQALAAAAHLLQQTRGYAIAGNYCDAALAIARAAGDDYLVAGLLHVRAWLLVRQGQPGAALPLIEQGLGLAEYLPAWPARLHGSADQALADLGHLLEPLETRLAGLDRQRPGAAMFAGAFDAEHAEGRTLDPVRAAHQALQGLQTGREASSADMLASEPDPALSGAAAPVLTPRELDVLKLVAKGLSNPDIAQQLFLSEHTVHRHLANILRKLNLPSRAAAAAWGVRTGLV
jgi:DNA-binding CsgD family transcriptional regulator